jgi:hypothetical protein
VIDPLHDEQAHDLGEAELDGVCVLERGDLGEAGLEKFQVNFPAPDEALLVKETTPFVAQGG